MAPSELLRRIERRRVTVLDLTPAYWHQLLALTGLADERLRSVRLMITGGEPADPEVCRAALRAAPWARLLNAYGLTETTITSALFDVGAGLARLAAGVVTVPVGRPVGRARIMVLDEELNPVADGTAGEICIGGPRWPGDISAAPRSPRSGSCPTPAAFPAAGCTAPETSAAG